MSNYSDSSFDESNHNTSWFKVFNFIPENSRVLDVGCSSGNFGKVLIEKKKCQVDGIELDENDFIVAKKKLNKVWRLNVETDDLKELGVKQYDVIYFGDVIEHLVDPISTLKRMKPLLKKEGVIIFSIPNMGHIGVRLALLAGKFEYTETGLLDKTHLHFYTQDEVVRVFEEAGYHLRKLEFIEKDYPKALLKEQLDKMGLVVKDQFYKKIAKTDASAFQFVGVARSGKVKQHRLEQFGPIDLFENFYENTKKNYEARIVDLEKELQKLGRELAHKRSHPFRNLGSYVKSKIQR